MGPRITPVRIDLKRDTALTIEWEDGLVSTYSLALLRTQCPCAQCKIVRTGTDPHQILQPADAPKKKSLTVLPGNFTTELSVVSAELVGNYALRIDWSDEHSSGIYSFQYLRDISPQQAKV